MDHDEIAALVERCRAGDDDAFVDLVRRTEGLVGAVVGRVLGAAGEVEEVMQDVYVDAHRVLADWRPGARFTTWLYRASTRAALARRRAAGRYRRHVEAAGQRQPRPTAADDPAAGLEARELRSALRQAIDALPEGQRATFVLRHDRQLPLAEIAEIRGVALGTVKAQLCQAVTRLRQVLGRSLA